MQTKPMDVQFRALHHQTLPLVLANAWDAGSARLIEQCGATAIATTSAGLAWSLGYPDGNKMPVDQHAAAIKRIARVIKVPLSVDLEACYGESASEVTARFLDAGAVGINLEDGVGSTESLCEKLPQHVLRHYVWESICTSMPVPMCMREAW